MYNYWIELLAFGSLVMLLAWAWQLRRGNPAIVDMIWAVLTPTLAILGILLSPEAHGPRSWVAMLGVGFWGARLALHLQQRLRHEGSDGRYNAMTRAMGDKAALGYFAFFQFQALGAYLLAFSPMAAAHVDSGALRVLDWGAVLVWVGSFAGESIADRQLSRFRNDPANKGKVCNTGLWHYSRHPNYFFEWLIWIAWFLMALGGDDWWVSLACAVAMYLLVTRFTGIPHVEAQSLRSRGDRYREYQETTRAFFLLPPKLSRASS